MQLLIISYIITTMNEVLNMKFSNSRNFLSAVFFLLDEVALGLSGNVKASKDV